jgi:hypothetical protein
MTHSGWVRSAVPVGEDVGYQQSGLAGRARLKKSIAPKMLVGKREYKASCRRICKGRFSSRAAPVRRVCARSPSPAPGRAGATGLQSTRWRRPRARETMSPAWAWLSPGVTPSTTMSKGVSTERLASIYALISRKAAGGLVFFLDFLTIVRHWRTISAGLLTEWKSSKPQFLPARYRSA